MLDSFKSKEFVRFIFAGGFAAIVNFGSRFIFNKYMSFGKAIVVAYLLGMLTAFVLTKLFVFDKSKHSTQKEFFYFSLVNVVAIIQTYFISIGLNDYVFPQVELNFHNKAVAHGIGVAFPLFTSFIGHKFLSFKGE